MFHLTCAVSLLLAVAMGWLWIKSFGREVEHLDFQKGQERLTLRSTRGQFVVVGPADLQVSDPEITDWAGRISNHDFEWNATAKFRGLVYVEGALREGTATWQLYQHCLKREREGKGLEMPTLRALQTAMENPERFAAAHFILAYAINENRKAYEIFQQSRWLDHFYTMRSSQGDQLSVSMRADPGGSSLRSRSGPDFSLRLDMQPELRELKQVERASLFHGWIFLALLVLPFAWLTRPRWRDQSWRRWSYNFVTLVLLVLCAGSAAMWVRSYRIFEQFFFERRPLKNLAGDYGDFYSFWSAGSSSGRLRLLDLEGAFGFDAFNYGYHNGANAVLWPTSGVPASGEKELNLPGIQYHQLPLSLTPAASSSGQFGGQWLAVGWWLLTALTAVLPIIWGWSALRWWRRWVRERRLQRKLCPRCGYDMRATPNRCPECGDMLAAKQETAVAASTN